MRSFLAILSLLVAIGLTLSGALADGDDGAIYGLVKAKGHKDVLAKWQAHATEKSDDRFGYGNDGELPAGAINYSNLSSIYVILEDPAYKGGRYHNVRLDSGGFWPGALALALGDKIRVENETDDDLTVYLAGDGDDDIQEFPVIEAGRSETIVVELSGQLELGIDELEDETMSVAAGPGWRTQRLSSGDDYEFEDLKPGNYLLLFWYWRLGSIERRVSLGAGQRLKVDEILSVDRIVK